MATGLFANPNDIRQGLLQQQFSQGQLNALLPPGRGPVAAASNIGTLIGNIPRLFGATTQQEKVAEARQKALMSAQQVAGDDPTSFLREASKRLMSIGDFQGAMSLVDKLQEVTANQANIGVANQTAALRGAQAENAAGQFEHDLDVIETQTEAKKELQQQQIDAERRMLNQKLGVQTAIESAKLDQASQQFQIEQLQKIRDWRVKADRAESYGQFVDAKENYWMESLKLKAKDLALKKERNKSLNATDEFRKFQAQAIKDFAQSSAVQAVEGLRDVLPRINNITPEKVDSMSYQSLLKLLPADERSRVTNSVNDFIGKLDPMERFMATQLESVGNNILPSRSEISQFAVTGDGSEDPDLFLDLTQE